MARRVYEYSVALANVEKIDFERSNSMLVYRKPNDYINEEKNRKERFAPVSFNCIITI